VKEAKYIKGATTLAQAPSDLPIFLLLGRSNVGKSSFINALTNRKNLAKTSGTPGKTIVLNYYLINNEFYLVDAPGYGYAKRAKSVKDDFIIMIENILIYHPKIVSVLLLIDFKVGPTNDDIEIYEFLLSLNLNVIVVATKMDKISSTRRYKQTNVIKEKIYNPPYFYAVSSANNINVSNVRKELLERIRNYETS